MEPPVRRFGVGDRVSHDQHGLGRVIGVEEDAVLVDFGSVQRRVLSPYGKMSVL